MNSPRYPGDDPPPPRELIDQHTHDRLRFLAETYEHDWDGEAARRDSTPRDPRPIG